MTDLFYGPHLDLRDEIGREEREDVAKAICAGCELRIACLQFALVNNDEYGVWGGMTQGERREFKIFLRKQGYKTLPVGKELQANVQFWFGDNGVGLVAEGDRARRVQERYASPSRVEALGDGRLTKDSERESRERTTA